MPDTFQYASGDALPLQSAEAVNYVRYCVAKALEELSPLLDSESADVLVPFSKVWHAVANAFDQISDVQQALDTRPEGDSAC